MTKELGSQCMFSTPAVSRSMPSRTKLMPWQPHPHRRASTRHDCAAEFTSRCTTQAFSYHVDDDTAPHRVRHKACTAPFAACVDLHASANSARQCKQCTPVQTVHASANSARQCKQCTPVQTVHASANSARQCKQCTPVQTVHASANSARQCKQCTQRKQCTPVQTVHAAQTVHASNAHDAAHATMLKAAPVPPLRASQCRQ